jgi:ethanolamine utilization protein EutN
MLIGQVIGRATATSKHPSMEGWRLLVVQPFKMDERSPDGDPLLAVDSQSAGVGDVVILTSDGKGTQQMLDSNTTPVRWSVLGIRD